jgi:hypothetical protein
MITHLDEVLCMVQAIQHCTNRAADHPMRFQRNLSWFEYVAQMAESMAAEWMVARTLGYDYSPGITWDKSKADVGNNIEVKWTPNPDGNLWIQDSDRHDRDIAVLVTGQQSNMKSKAGYLWPLPKSRDTEAHPKTIGRCLNSIYSLLRRY